MAQEQDNLLNRPLYVFDLPQTLLSSLVLKSEQEAAPTIQAVEEVSQKDGDASTATSCGLCGIASSTVADQRAHAKSDFHRFNLKRKIQGQPAVAEVEFEHMLEGLSESISGSENESESEDGTATEPLSILLRKKAVIAAGALGDEDEVKRKKMGPGRAPLVWFTSPLLPPTVSLGVYRALFPDVQKETSKFLPSLVSMQIPPPPKQINRHIFLCMVGGGHFAAMIVSLSPKVGKRHNSGADERQAVVIAHKTFHRYTTRRKQGGAQSSNDAAKGNAHSAGASIRRYNEAALTTEIRELLGSWKDMLDTAELLFIRATGTNNRRSLFGYDGAPLKSNDPRIHGFPFSTRRATQSELLRCFVELTRIKISHIDEAALAALSAADTAPPDSTRSIPKPTIPKISKEEESLLSHSTQLTALIRRSKAPALLSYMTTNKLSPDFEFHPPNHHSPTLLHLAASINSPAIVSALLTKASANPTILNGDTKPAFDLAGDRATRDAFRVSRGELGEEKWDWAKSKIPPALSKKQAESRDKREKEEQEKEEKGRREQELKKLKEKPEPVMKSRPGTLGTAAGTRDEAVKGLSADARVKLERERRARAAEERMKRMQASGGG